MAESEEALQLKRRARRRLVGAIALVSFVVIILPLLLDKEPGPAGPPLDVQIPRQEPGGFTGRIGPGPAQSPAAAVPATEKNAEAVQANPAPEVSSAQAPANKAETPAAKALTPVPKVESFLAKPAPAKQETAKEETAKEETARVAPAPAEPAKPVPIALDKAATTAPSGLDKTEQERAQAALRDEIWVVALDAFSDLKNVKQLRSKLSEAGVKSYTEAVKTSKGELTRVRAGPFASKEAAEKARAKLEAMGLKPGAVASR